MKKLDLGQTITILANLGVIAGILFLGIELQQNNALLGAQARTARFEVAIDSTNMIVSTPSIARAQMKDRNGEPLTEEEEYILTEWYWGTFTRWQYGPVLKKIDLSQTVGILANVGVILGLVLLSMEIRQSNKQAEATAYQTRIDSIGGAAQQYSLSSILPAIYIKLDDAGVDSLDAEERNRVLNWEQARRLRMEAQFYQYQQGFLDESAYRTMLRTAQSHLSLWTEIGLANPNQDFLQAVREFRE